MSKLTYRDVPLLQTRGAQLSSSRTAWWLKDKQGEDWYVRENEDNQYLLFAPMMSATTMAQADTMEREEFERLFP